MNHAGILSNCPGSVCLMAVHFLAAKVSLVCKRDAAKTRSPSSSPVLPSFLPQSSGDLGSGFSVMFFSLFPLWPLYKGSKCHHSPNQRTGGSDATIDFIFCDQIIKYSSNTELISLCVLSLWPSSEPGVLKARIWTMLWLQLWESHVRTLEITWF